MLSRLAFVILALSVLPIAFEALAASGALSGQFTTAKVRTGEVYDQVRDGVLFIAGAALFGCGAAALTGRMPWKWFWTLGGGIFLIGVAGLVINEITGKGSIGLGIF